MLNGCDDLVDEERGHISGGVGLMYVEILIFIIVWITIFIAGHETLSPLVTPR
jgi:hypothetical protein